MGEEEWQRPARADRQRLADARAQGRRVRARIRRASSGQARGCSHLRDDGAAPCARRARHRPWRRSHRPVLHLDRDRQRRALLRRDSGVRRHRSRHLQHRSVARRHQGHAAHASAIIPVHLFGLCADIDAIRGFCRPASTSSRMPPAPRAPSIAGDRRGGLGTAGVFSFHPRKSITTGEGGMLTTDDDALAKRASALRNHGASDSRGGASRRTEALYSRRIQPAGLQLPHDRSARRRWDWCSSRNSTGSSTERRGWAEYYRRHLRRS